MKNRDALKENVKRYILDVIEYLDTLVDEEIDQRSISIAKTHLETASMWAVKSLYK